MATPAGEYAQWYAGWERDLDKALRQAARTAEKAASALPVGATGTMKGVRVRMASATMSNGINTLFKDIEVMLKTGRIEAAGLAGRLAAQQDVEMFKALGMSAKDAAYYVEAEALRAAAALEAAGLRVTQTGIPLSSQVYRTQALSSGMVDKMVTSGLAQGLNARDLAKSVRQYIDPSTPGGVSFASKRLSRTEINNAFHQSSINRMKAKPWVEGIQWQLSGSHPRNDICNEYADEDGFNLGAGVYPPSEAPDKPHPQCMCYVTSVMPDEQQFLDNVMSGQYDTYLDEIMGQSGYTDDMIHSAVPKPGPDGKRAVSKSKDPLVRQKVADLDEDQYLRWMNDTRPVAQKMADPRYATDGAAKPLPKTPKPEPKVAEVKPGEVATNKNGARVMEDRWMEDLKSERGKVGWEVKDGKIIWDDGAGLAKALKAARRELSDARLTLQDPLLSDSMRKAQQGIANAMERLVADLEKAADNIDDVLKAKPIPDGGGVVKPKTTVIDDLEEEIRGYQGFPSENLEGWRIEKGRIVFDGELGRANLLELAQQLEDDLLQRARQAYVAKDKLRAKAHAKNMREFIDELKAKAPSTSKPGLDDIPAYLSEKQQAIINRMRNGQKLNDADDYALSMAMDDYVLHQPMPRGSIPYSVRIDISDYYKQQFRMRVLGEKVQWPLEDPIPDFLRTRVRWDGVSQNIGHPVMPGGYGPGVSYDSIRREVTQIIDDIYDRFMPGQLSPSSLTTMTQKGFRRARTLADANQGTYEVRIGTNVVTQRKGIYSQHSGWWVKVDDGTDLLREVITHEYGHITDYGLTVAERWEVFSRIARALGLPEPQKGYAQHDILDRWVKRHKVKITSQVSKYGSTNSYEILAELFAETQLNSFPRAAAAAYRDYLIEIGRLKPVAKAAKPKPAAVKVVETPADDLTKFKAVDASDVPKPKITGGDMYDALEKYQDQSFPYNTYLRHGAGNVDAADDAADVVKQLDIAMRGSSIDADIVTYRGLSGYDSALYRDLRVGDRFHDQGYMSTTTDLSVAEDFAQTMLFGDHGMPAMFKIHVPKGSRGFNIDVHQDYAFQKEVLLDRNSDLRVVGIRIVDGPDGKIRLFDVVLEQKPW